MKIKWLIILFIFFLGVILLSLLITQQSQKAVSLSEQGISITEQVESRIPPIYSPQVRPMLTAKLPLVKSGISIIKIPSIVNKGDGSFFPESGSRKREPSPLFEPSTLFTETEDSSQAGITKIGKQPTPQEAQEMNSRGIVLY